MSDKALVRANRYNANKPRMDLLPWDVLLELAHHYRVGAEKYDARNWEKGLKWNEGTAASLARHLAAWSMGEDIDPENGQHHDLAILWNACSLVAYRIRQIGKDDRPCVKNPTQNDQEQKDLNYQNVMELVGLVPDGGATVMDHFDPKTMANLYVTLTDQAPGTTKPVGTT